MSAARPVESRLPEILEGISAPRTPDYFDDILGQVGRTRQRPRWTFPERWIPMTALSERVATAPRIPMRMAVALALLLLALAVSLVLIAGSQRPSVPAPFGVAGNGQIVFVDDTGAVRVGDLDGSSTVVVPGPGHMRPVFSPDGRRLAYFQVSGNGRTDIAVSGPHGESPLVITPTAVSKDGFFGWTPDSQKVVVGVGRQVYAYDPTTTALPIKLVDDITTDGFNNSITDLFRPPTGAEVLQVGYADQGTGLYRRVIATGALIPVLTDKTSPMPLSNIASPQWSPDGQRIVFTFHPPETPDFGRAYVINADGSGLKQVSAFEMPPSYIVDEEHTAWSPDGSRVGFMRWIMDQDGNNNVRPVVVVDVATGHEQEMSNVEVNGYGGWSWSPDGKNILEVPGGGSADEGQVIVLDATTGEFVKRTGWTADAGFPPAWQRTVPLK